MFVSVFAPVVSRTSIASASGVSAAATRIRPRPLNLAGPQTTRATVRMSGSARAGATEQESVVLYVKASPLDGVSLGDCPFSHKVGMALSLKGVDFGRVHIDTGNKPEWYFDLNPNGSVPTLRVRGAAGGKDALITDSEEGLQYLDDTKNVELLHCAQEAPALYPNSLDEDEAQRLNGVIGPIFPAFVACLKNKDADKVDELSADLTSKLCALNDYLETSKRGKFLCGDTLSAYDCNLAPKLYHLRIVGSNLSSKKIGIPDHCSRLLQYVQDVESQDAFQSSLYPEDVVMAGWSKFL